MTSKTTTMAVAALFALAALPRAAAGQPQPPAQAQPQQQARAQAAAANPELLKQLDRDIWIPFSEAFAAADSERFMGLHSKELVRVEGGRKQVLGWAQYAEQNRRSFETQKSRGGKVAIDFRFLERIAGPEMASERGIFQFTMTPATPTTPGGSEPRRFYGKFHVISRKENGVWKILVDYDSNEGGTIDEKSWQAAFARDDYGKY